MRRSRNNLFSKFELNGKIMRPQSEVIIKGKNYSYLQNFGKRCGSHVLVHAVHMWCLTVHMIKHPFVGMRHQQTIFSKFGFGK